MRILRVHILNLNSLKLQTTIDFSAPPLSQTGIFAITGPTGAGKTTILDAITLALYGRLARSKDVKEVLSFGATECRAEVEFVTKEGQFLASWRVYRARGKADGSLLGPKRELAKWEAEKQTYSAVAEKIREVDQAVEEITGLDYHRFTRSVLLSQGDFAAFLKADERERSELLERITGTDIYTQLSIAAFERAKQEKLQLEQLQEQLQHLGLQSEEPVTTADKEQAQQATGEAQKVLKQLQQQLQGKMQLKTAEEKLLALQEEESLLETAQKEFAHTATKLEAALALRPHVSSFDELEQLHKQQLSWAIDIEQKQKEVTETSTQVEQILVQLTQVEKELHAIKQRQQTDEKNWQQVDKLDEQLLIIQRQARETTATELKMGETLQSWRQALAATTEKLKQIGQDMETGHAWLVANEQWRTIVRELPAIEQQRERLGELFRTRRTQEARVAELNQRQSRSRELLAKHDESLSGLSKEIAKFNQGIQQALPKGFDASQQEAAARLPVEISQLKDRMQQLQQLAAIDEDYKQLLQELGGYEERLGELQLHQQQLSAQVLNLVEERTAFATTLQYKKTVYQQQQLVANYAKDRQHLVEGEPCPLCGAIDHPFAAHGVTPYVDEAKAELEEAEAYVEQINQRERHLLLQESELDQEIKLLRGQDIDTVKGRLAGQLQKMESYEAKIATILAEPDTIVSRERGTALKDRLHSMFDQLAQWQGAQQQIEQLNKELLAQQEQYQQLEKVRSAEAATLYGLDEQLQQATEQLQTNNQSFDQATEQLQANLSPLGKTFELYTAKTLFASLREGVAIWQGAKEKQEELDTERNKLTSKAEQLQPQIASQQEQLDEQQKNLESLRKRITKLKKDRIEIAGDAEVSALRQASQQTVLDKETQQAAVQQLAANTRESLSSLRQSLVERQEQLKRAQKRSDQLTKSLNKVLQKLGYSHIKEAIAMRLSFEEEQNLQAQADSLTQRRVALATARKTADEQRQQWLEFEKFDLDVVSEEHDKAELNYQQLLRQLGQLEQQLKQQQEREAKHKELLDKLEEQRAHYNRWAELNELIGQADGKKFRSFAQGLTLQKLVALANVHLQKLNGRYYIQKRAETDLELDIVDTFQADNTRSMYTLSGGESFLVSLALALGLSDLAGRHAQIESLFIDEGFGTLDEHSLDLALDTLENLQASGKTIGIISHVKALKERIGVQIKVRKRSSGHSTIQVE